jgi:hypothetical protein
MKRNLWLILPLLVVTLASAHSWTYWYQAFGNATGNTVRGTAADTVWLPDGLLRGVTSLAFRVRADSVVDSVPNLQALLDVKWAIHGSWITTSFATADAGDTIVPLDGSIFDTLLTQQALLPWLAMNADSARVRFVGKRAAQCAKACSVEVRVRR